MRKKLRVETNRSTHKGRLRTCISIYAAKPRSMCKKKHPRRLAGKHWKYLPISHCSPKVSHLEMFFFAYRRIVVFYETLSVAAKKRNLRYSLFFQTMYARSSGVRNDAVTGKSTNTDLRSVSQIDDASVQPHPRMQATQQKQWWFLPKSVCNLWIVNEKGVRATTYEDPRPASQTSRAVHETDTIC